MTRFLRSLLLGYAVGMTLLAAWLGSRALIYWRIITGVSGMKASDPSHEQVMANVGAPRSLPGWSNQLAMMVAVIEPVNIAAAVFVVVLATFALASRRTSRGNSPDIKED